MGYLETACVVYARRVWYPDGFGFPLTPMDDAFVQTELLREAATVVMLVAAGWLAVPSGDGASRKNKLAMRFGWFIFCFGIWDIAYYGFLKVLLGWPESIMTWDLLFLVPMPWTGPVAAPLIVSISMVFLTSVLLRFYRRLRNTPLITSTEWFILIGGAATIIVSMCWDFARHVLNTSGNIFDIFSFTSENEALFDAAHPYIPESYPWWLFWIGWVICLGGVAHLIRRHKRI